jgi:hypothetical protein
MTPERMSRILPQRFVGLSEEELELSELQLSMMSVSVMVADNSKVHLI